MTEVPLGPLDNIDVPPTLYVVGRAPDLDRFVRIAVFCGTLSLSGYAAAAAVGGLAKPGSWTGLLWLAAILLALIAIASAFTPAMLQGGPAAALVISTDILLVAALWSLEDRNLAFMGCMIFSGPALFASIHASTTVLSTHLSLTLGFTLFTSATVAQRTETSGVAIVIGTLALVAISGGIPIVIRKIWKSTSRTAESASFDPLTGLLNRGGLARSFRRLAAEAEVEHATMAVIVIDIDAFKTINDTFGHGTGDAVLVETAFHLSDHYGDRAAVARSGGEEFTVLAIGSRAELEALITATPTSTPGVRGPSVTMSVGAAWCEYEESYPGLRRAIISADRSMYDAKARGGDRVRLA